MINALLECVAGMGVLTNEVKPTREDVKSWVYTICDKISNFFLFAYTYSPYVSDLGL